MSPEKRVIPQQRGGPNHDSAQELCTVIGKMGKVFDGAASDNPIVKSWTATQKTVLKPTMIDLFTAISYHANKSFRNVTTPKGASEMDIMIYGERAGIIPIPIFNEREHNITIPDMKKGAKSLFETMLGFLQEGVTTQEEFKAKSKPGGSNRLTTARSVRSARFR